MKAQVTRLQEKLAETTEHRDLWRNTGTFAARPYQMTHYLQRTTTCTPSDENTASESGSSARCPSWTHSVGPDPTEAGNDGCPSLVEEQDYAIGQLEAKLEEEREEKRELLRKLRDPAAATGS